MGSTVYLSHREHVIRFHLKEPGFNAGQASVAFFLVDIEGGLEGFT